MMMITCWIGVAGDLANAGATFVSVQSALVARQSDSKNHFDLMNILHREGEAVVCDRGAAVLLQTVRTPAPASIGGRDCRAMSGGNQICEMRLIDRKRPDRIALRA